MTFFNILITAIIMAVFGWGGIGFIMFFTLPTLGPRWLLFFFLVFAVSGLVLPLLAILNQRFSRTSVPAYVIIRQALWFGLGADLLLWLSMGRELTLPLGLMIAAGFVVIEYLLRLSETSKWNANEE